MKIPLLKITILVCIIIIVIGAWLAYQEARFNECVAYWSSQPYIKEDVARWMCRKGAWYP